MPPTTCPFLVTSPNGHRTWIADDSNHALEQHDDAFDGDPGEEVLAVAKASDTRPSPVALDDRADERDHQNAAAYAAALTDRDGPQVGDFVIFACGTRRRISHLWPDSAQTSAPEEGRWSLNEHGASFSGTLHPPVPLTHLYETGTYDQGSAWIWKGRIPGARRALTYQFGFAVWTSPLPAPN